MLMCATIATRAGVSRAGPHYPGDGGRQPASGRIREVSVDEAFAVDEHDDGELAHVVVQGELDVAAAPTLRERLHATVDRSTGAVIVDLLGVTFIDSTALGVLIGTKERADERGIDLRLVVHEARIIKIFEITGLTELFSISATVAEASAQ